MSDGGARVALKIRLAVLAVTLVGGLVVVAHASANPRFAATSTLKAPIRTAALTPAWTTYHLDNARDGNDTTEGVVSGLTTGWTALTAGGSTTLDGSVYASPLVYGTSVYVATENNTIYAFNTANGHELWHVHMGAPEDGGLLPCGNINPVGVTGTPVIDPAADGGNGVLFMVGMTSEPHYRLFGTDLVTHAVVVDSVVDAGDIRVQGQRGALALSGGLVYIPYGGRAGDCSDNIPPFTPYYGIVVAARESDGTGLYEFVPSGTTAAGIWAPGGESVDGSGNVYVATGNGSGPGSESVFKLSPTLGVLNQWRPTNANFLDNNDIDVGSISPALVGGGDVFQNGKYGHAFLLGSSLSQLTADPGLVDCGGVTSDASFGATAYASPYIYVPCSAGVFAVQQSGSTITNVWHQLSSFAGPPIVAGGAVWTLSGSNLYGFKAANGTQIANVSVGSFSRFETPAAGGGKIFVAGNNFLKAFNFVTGGCSTAGLSAVPPTSQAQGMSVTFNATASGPACSAPLFEFWLQNPAGTWTLEQPFSSTASWTWTTTGFPVGAYTVHVWANQTGDPQTTYEGLGSLPYSLTGCSSASLTPPAGSFAGGSTIAFTAGASGCSNPEFEYWVLPPGSYWQTLRSYGPATFNWNTSGLALGTYQIAVWARQQGGGTPTYETAAGGGYTLTGCTSPSVSPLPGSFPVTSTISFTAGANGCAPEFEYWVLPPGGSWQVLRTYGGASFSWNTTGLAPGTYQISIWIRRQGSSAAYETFTGGAYTLTGCSSAMLTPAPGSFAHGTTINFVASSSGCANPEYEYWVLPPGGYWQVLRTYGAAAFNWNTAGLPLGTYQIAVWVRQQGSGTLYYDSGAGGAYTLT